MRKFSILNICILLFTLWSSTIIYGQELKHKPRKSEVGLVNFRDGENYVKVTYGRPKMKHERHHPFGYNVPWRKLWRFGDDDATEITFTKPVIFGEDTLNTGTYALFAIPDTAEWTMIVNKELGQWGTFKYRQEYDIARMKIPAFKSPYVFMQFSIFLQETDEFYGCNLIAIWDRRSIVIPIRFLKEEDLLINTEEADSLNVTE
ncbi:DUF2911 domain-containing protein [Sediminitomix flava]|uniref:DUF2911 family protein n=1 Tax=Sediminitomix flava TaxID=379075 RepID=A0A315ZH27_SEDFL|nr:DUF2911 domain-containing protein [Sediminitomix flava]PWJ44811.1 Protein of unknown function (DUF2911) [Sediminitomix flava]